MVASASIPSVLDELEAKRRSAPPERDAGLATSPRPELMLDLEYHPEVAPDTARDVATQEVATKHEGAIVRAQRADRPVCGSPGRAPAEAPHPRTPNSPLTETGLIFGTPQYMAQELTTGTKNATRASDVFSLGIIAFELLTGKRPFPEAPVSAKLNGRALPMAVPLRTVCPTLPASIATLLDRAMMHDPRARPSATELAAALRDAADELSGARVV